MRHPISLLALSVLLLASCTDGSRSRSVASADASSTGVDEKAALLAAIQRQADRQFVAVAGEREFSGRMIARPLQRDALRVLGLDENDSNDRRARARAELGRFRIVDNVPQTDETIFELPAGGDANATARRLMATMAFQYVEPDWIVFPIVCPEDTFFNLQWNHEANRMRSCDAWDLHTGNPSVAVTICDTGIRTTHEDLQLHRLEAYNAVDRVWENSGGNISPVHPHGTQTTGCAAANGNNGLGVAGVGWNLSHRMMRVSNLSSGSAPISTLQHAARTGIESGDRVASVSYSGPDSSSNLTTATYIKSIGGLLVWAAGNDGRNLTFGNRDNDDLIVAGATDSNDLKASFSAFGNFVDLVAPGVSVPTTSTSSNSSYVYATGTSFACPITAGLCALIWSSNPGLSPDQVENFLKQACDDLGSAGVDNTFGYGRVNSYEALVLAAGGGSPPVAEFSGTPTSGTAPLNVSFTDLSTNSPTSWSWSFGDGGNSSSQNPSHTYNSAGTYTVSLTATNGFGNGTESKVGYITVSPGGTAPTADFSGTPTSGTAPLNVSFTDLSTNSPTSWSWSFGDGGNSSSQNPSHTYNSAGTYTVSLTASNAFGDDAATKVGYISVSPGGTAPTAEFSGTPTTGTAPLVVSFTDLSTGVPTSWSWDFGDGNGSNVQNPSHTYTLPGSYTVSLTATNSFGSDPETKVAYITVNGGGAEEQLAFDGWESNNFSGGTGWNGGWTAGGDVRIRNNSPHTGTRHVRLRRGTGLLRRQVDLTGATAAKLVFWARIESFEGSDECHVKVSTNGSTWTNLTTFVNGDDNNTYQRHEFEIPVGSNVWIEFDAAMSGRGDRAYFDDIEIVGVQL